LEILFLTLFHHHLLLLLHPPSDPLLPPPDRILQPSLPSLPLPDTIPSPILPIWILQLNLIPACRTLHILFEPLPQAVQVKDMPALQFLRLLDLLEADDAGVVDAWGEVLRGVYIGQTF